MTTVVAPDVQRRNLILGLTLGAVVIAMVTTWILAFTREGLPKDPAIWKKMQEATSLPTTPAPVTAPAPLAPASKP